MPGWGTGVWRWQQAHDWWDTKEPAWLWGSNIASCAHLVPPQLLLNNVVPVLHGLPQPPETWGGKELAGSKTVWLLGRKEACPRPTPPPRSQGCLGSTSHPEKGDDVQNLDGPVVPGFHQVLDTVVKGMY